MRRNYQVKQRKLRVHQSGASSLLVLISRLPILTPSLLHKKQKCCLWIAAEQKALASSGSSQNISRNTAFGGSSKNRQPADDRSLMIGTVLQDMRYGVRILFKNPGVTFVIVLTLALGIGASTTVFSVVNGVM